MPKFLVAHPDRNILTHVAQRHFDDYSHGKPSEEDVARIILGHAHNRGNYHLGKVTVTNEGENYPRGTVDGEPYSIHDAADFKPLRAARRK